jgi:formylglycine-generating enzyme required for sulfatase activity
LYENVSEETVTSQFATESDGFAWTSPVGKFKPNAFGLYDMHGNAYEWCSDWYDKNYYKNSPEDDPQGPATGMLRVLRGGAYNASLESNRCASRLADPPSTRACGYGFRIVRDR